MTDRRRVLGAVLAGGASSRFGSDKALATLGGRTLLALAGEAVAPFVDAVVVVGRGDGVPDRPRAGLGPLGGIAGALAYGRAQGFASVVTIACDMPDVPSELIERLLVEAPAYCPDASVLGHWPTSLADALAEHLAPSTPSSRRDGGILDAATQPNVAPERPRLPGQTLHDRRGRDGRLSVRRWADAIGAVPIAATAPLRNINTLADLPTP